MNHSGDAGFVEQALESLRDVAIPDGPSAELSDATTGRLQAAANDDATSLPPRGRNMMFRFLRYGSATAVCASIISAIVWFGVLERSATITFADVQAEVQKTRSVQFVETRIKSPFEVIPPKLEPQYQPRRHFVLGRQLLRTELVQPDGSVSYVSISDERTGKRVMLYPKEKRCVTLESRAPTEAKKKTESKSAPVAMYDAVREVPAEATTRLAVKMLDGKQVVGFVEEKNLGKNGETDIWKRTWWVDVETKLPVRIEISRSSTNKFIGAQEWVQSDIVFDAELPESLFSTDPPEGYRVETGPTGRAK